MEFLNRIVDYIGVKKEGMKEYFIKYTIEIIVIIFSITVSIWLNDKSIENQNERERIKILSSLQMEINEIKFYCNEKKANMGK